MGIRVQSRRSGSRKKKQKIVVVARKKKKEGNIYLSKEEKKKKKRGKKKKNRAAVSNLRNFKKVYIGFIVFLFNHPPQKKSSKTNPNPAGVSQIRVT